MRAKVLLFNFPVEPVCDRGSRVRQPRKIATISLKFRFLLRGQGRARHPEATTSSLVVRLRAEIDEDVNEPLDRLLGETLLVAETSNSPEAPAFQPVELKTRYSWPPRRKLLTSLNPSLT